MTQYRLRFKSDINAGTLIYRNLLADVLEKGLEQSVDATYTDPNGWHHVVFTTHEDDVVIEFGGGSSGPPEHDTKRGSG